MPSRVPMPTVDRLDDLPLLLDTVVTDAHEDANGHLNVAGYLALHSQAAWPWLRGHGLDPSASGQPRGVMDLENHLRYLAEVHVGDHVTIHGQLLGRAERRIHGIWYLVNQTRGLLSNTYEFVSVHVDLEKRRATPFDDDTAAALDAEVTTTARNWAPPVSGTMSL